MYDGYVCVVCMYGIVCMYIRCDMRVCLICYVCMYATHAMYAMYAL